MFCSKCGKEISDGMAFCNHCGNPVEDSKTTASGSMKSTAGSLFRSFQEKAKSVSESINAAAEEAQKKTEEDKKTQDEKSIPNTSRKQTKQYTGKQEGRFIEDTFVNGVFSCYGTVLVDRFTGVNYLFVYKGDCGGLTVLVDENGKPLVTKDRIETNSTEEE